VFVIVSTTRWPSDFAIVRETVKCSDSSERKHFYDKPGGPLPWLPGELDITKHKVPLESRLAATCPNLSTHAVRLKPQRVEDSGAGSAYLVFGTYGIRLKPVSLSEDWDVNSANQWGELYLLLADPKDIKYEDTNIG
jgi:hypothetical protein